MRELQKATPIFILRDIAPDELSWQLSRGRRDSSLLHERSLQILRPEVYNRSKPHRVTNTARCAVSRMQF